MRKRKNGERKARREENGGPGIANLGVLTQTEMVRFREIFVLGKALSRSARAVYEPPPALAPSQEYRAYFKGKQHSMARKDRGRWPLSVCVNRP